MIRFFQMLEAVLKNVTTSDLLNCRQVSHQWNGISSEIFRKRADINLHFVYRYGRFVQMLRNRHCVELLEDIEEPSSRYGTKTLTDLVDCFAESKHFPYSNFRFNRLSKCRSSDMTRFISLWGKDIVTLKVSVDEPERNIGIMKDLIFEKVPNLKHLEIEFWEETYDLPSPVRLFDDSDQLQLPKLEVLCVCDRDRKYRRVVEDILKAASNLNKFVVSLKKYDFVNASDLKMLQTLGKLHCLKNLQITRDLITYWKMLPKSMDLKIHSLTVQSIVDDQSAIELINELLWSSKDVIHTLSIEQSALLTSLAIPILENLHTLGLHFNLFTSITDLSDLADTFPNVKTLGKISTIIDSNGTLKMFISFQTFIATMSTRYMLGLFSHKKLCQVSRFCEFMK